MLPITHPRTAAPTETTDGDNGHAHAQPEKHASFGSAVVQNIQLLLLLFALFRTPQEGCDRHPSFGWKHADGKATRCAHHRLEGMESVKVNNRRGSAAAAAAIALKAK